MTLFGQETPQERLRFFFVLGTMTASIATLVVDSLFFHGVVSAAYWGYAFYGIFMGYALLTQDQLILKLVVFGLVAGLAELAVDHWLVAVSDSLVYPLDENMLWSSPAYMPFSWTVVLVEFGYLSWLFSRKLGPIVAGLIVAVLGAMLVPLYEHWAISAEWWYYHNTKLWGTVPIYIIAAEGLLMLPVPFFVQKMDQSKSPVKLPLLFGLLEAVVMMVAVLIGWYALG